LSGGRHRRPGSLNWRRIGILCVAFLTASAVTATATAGVLVWYGERQIESVDVETAVPGDVDGDGSIDIPELADLRNVLLVGSDSREGLTARDRRELGTGDFEGVRTDTIILVQLDPKRHGAAMLSFPRDLLVERCDGSQGRINGAYEVGRLSGVGGPTCMVRTVANLTGIPIHHYAQVDFQGFVDVVDTLGGVTLYLNEPIQDADAHIDLPAGCVTLSGIEALGFVRVRKIDSDFGRIARQQRFIREIIDQVTSASVALNIPKLFSLVEAGAKAVETDPSLSLGVMRQIAFSFRDISSDQIDARTVPGFNRLIDGVAYVVADPVAAEPLFAAFRAGVAAPAEIGTEGPGDVRISDVPPLTVLNATRTGGLAASAAEALRVQGFEIAATGNASFQDATYTRILHPRDQREEAELIAEFFPGARLSRDDLADGFTIELGADTNLDHLRELASEPPAPTGPPEPAPQPTFRGAASDRRDC
jgi:LCP family protein required for cell wall assembly